jgi:hypothetical protein
MPIYGAFTHCGIFVNGLDITGLANMVKVTATKEVRDRTTFGNASRVRVMGGIEDISLAAAGFLDMSLAGQEAAFRNNLYADDINTTVMIPAASGIPPAPGDLAYFFKGTMPKYDLGGGQGSDLLWNLSLQGGQGGLPLCFGRVLDPGTTAILADGYGSGVQAGAVAADRYAYALVHVVEISAGDDIVVTIESAAANDFAGATTRFTFASKSAAGSEFPARIAGPVTDTLWWAVYDVTGAGVSIKAAVVLAIQ